MSGGDGRRDGIGIGFGRTQFIAEPTHRLPTAGEVIAGRFTVGELLGRGGAGAVFQVVDKLTGRTLALKLILVERMGRADAREAMIREAVTARDIRHPNVVAVYDVGEWEGQPFITMELLPGRTLRAALGAQMTADSDMPLAKAVTIVRALLDGLEAAHAQLVVHRDLKPENVFLTAEPDAGNPGLKIIDFGIARQLHAGMPVTGSSSGTPVYMAPEQMTSPAAVNAAADIYSLSVMFYELLAGVPPLGHWQPPSQGRKDVPAKIDALIQAGMSVNRRARPQSVAEYRKLLDEALAGPKTAEPPKAETEPTKPKTKAGPAKPDDDAAATPAEVRLAADKVLRESGGEEKAVALARSLYLDAASAPEHLFETRQGDGIAMAAFAYMASVGYGGPADIDVAVEWYGQADALGVDQAEVATRLIPWLEKAKVHQAEQVDAPKTPPPKPRPKPKPAEPEFSIATPADADEADALCVKADALLKSGGAAKAAEARAMYDKAAEFGSGEAMAALGYMLANGVGGPRQLAAAREWDFSARTVGADVAAVHARIAEWLKGGAGPAASPSPKASPDDGKAIADKLYADATKLYRNGTGYPGELKTARELFLKAANLGDSRAMTLLGFMLGTGMGGPKDDVAGRQWTLKAANLGHLMAMTNLGVMLGAGQGGPKDEAAAREWNRKAAEAGYADGMHAYALALRYGDGGPKDEVAARNWFGKGAQKDQAACMYNFGAYLCDGTGGPADAKAGRDWLRKSAEAGHKLGLWRYGLALLNGEGGAKDAPGAREWTRKGAEAGSMDAAYNLGWMMSRATGGPKDLPGARQWFETAARAGQVQAQVSLAKMMLNGEGGAKDKPSALKWLREAQTGATAASLEARELLKKHGG